MNRSITRVVQAGFIAMMLGAGGGAIAQAVDPLKPAPTPESKAVDTSGQKWDATSGAPLPIPPVTDVAVAFVDVLRPAIDVVKTALVPVVLDENSVPEEGPDVPDVRPAEYLYEVENTGTVALDLDPDNDPPAPQDPPVDDTCAPLVFVPATDVNANGLLDVDEVWQYRCETTLDRAADSNTPPVTGAEGRQALALAERLLHSIHGHPMISSFVRK